METSEMDKLARMGAALPEGLDQPEQLYYLSIRQLYWAFDKGALDKERAAAEKRELLRQLEVRRLDYARYQELCRIRVGMAIINLKIQTGSCPVCKRMVRILDGMDGAYSLPAGHERREQAG